MGGGKREREGEGKKEKEREKEREKKSKDNFGGKIRKKKVMQLKWMERGRKGMK